MHADVMTVTPLRIIKKHSNNVSPPLPPRPIDPMLQDLTLSERKAGMSTSHELTYRRVIHAFSVEQSDTTYLRLKQDQIIHVHFQHFSGWADGTLIATKERGWFPLEYTEPYILMAVRPIVATSHGLYALFSAHKYEEYTFGISSLISGIRELLIRTNSLTQDSSILTNDPAVLHKRKLLLNGLNKLISLTKNVSEPSTTYSTNKDPSKELISYLNRIVLWSKQFAHLVGPEKEAYDESLLLPMSVLNSKIPNHNIYTHPKVSSVDSSSSSLVDSHIDKMHAKKLDSNLSSKDLLHSQPYSDSSSAFRNLTSSNDNFLSHLSSFIGRLHLHSYTSTQLLFTAKQCIATSRELLSILEYISIKHPDTQLYIAKESFYTKITSFIAVVKRIILSHCSISDDSNEENTIDKSECKRLIDAAANCVRGAGQCVMKAKFILELVGDFNISTLLSKQTSDSSSILLDTHFSKDSTTLENILSQETNESYKAFSTTCSEQLISNTSKKEKELQNDCLTFSNNISEESINNENDNFCFDNDTKSSIKYVSNKSLTGGSVSSCGLSIKPTIPSHTYSSTSECSEKTSSDNKFKHQDLPSGTASSFASSERFSITSSYAEPVSSPATSPEPTELDGLSGGKEDKKNFKYILFNQDGQVLGASLEALVERMTMHDTTPDATFASTFYLTFRFFTTPCDLALTLIERFPTDRPSDADQTWDHSYAMPVRLRVYNVFKTWMENYWHNDSDEEALDIIKNFVCQLNKYLPQISARLDDLVNRVSSRTTNIQSTHISRKFYSLSNKSTHSDLSIPSIIISKNLLTQLKTTSLDNNPDSFSITNFDPLEIARQLTLKESKLFCSILPEELIDLKTSQKTNTSPTVKAMAALSTDIAGWVAESILSQSDVKKRAAIMKQWIKIGNKCLELNNYNTLMAILSALNSSTISRLTKTWNTLSTKSKNIFGNLRTITDCSRNYAIYRSRLRKHLPPCLPFLGLILTDITFIEEGNPSYRPFKTSTKTIHSIQLINYDKYIKIYSIISKLQQFQEPYKLEYVEELQTWIESQVSRVHIKGQNNVTELWRKSLALEPKTPCQSLREEIDQTRNDTDNDLLIIKKTDGESNAKKSTYEDLNSIVEWSTTPVTKQII